MGLPEECFPVRSRSVTECRALRGRRLILLIAIQPRFLAVPCKVFDSLGNTLLPFRMFTGSACPTIHRLPPPSQRTSLQTRLLRPRPFCGAFQHCFFPFEPTLPPAPNPTRSSHSLPWQLQFRHALPHTFRHSGGGASSRVSVFRLSDVFDGLLAPYPFYFHTVAYSLKNWISRKPFRICSLRTLSQNSRVRGSLATRHFTPWNKTPSHASSPISTPTAWY